MRVKKSKLSRIAVRLVKRPKVNKRRAKRATQPVNLVSMDKAERLLQHVKVSRSEMKKLGEPLYVLNPEQAERLLGRLVLNKVTIRKLGESLRPGAQITLSAGCCCTTATHPIGRLRAGDPI